MATYSGTVYNVLGNAIGYTFSADVTYTQSIENNTTTLTITPKVSSGNDVGYAISMYFKVDGVDYHNAYHNFGTWGTTYTASSYTKVINHNADGTKTFTLNVSFETTYTQGANANLNKGTPKSGTISKSITLPTIPRASSFSFTDGLTMGTTSTITISRASSSFTHTLKYAFGNTSGTIGTGLGTSVKWTPSKDLGNQIPSSTSGVGALELKTYNNGTLVGTSTKTFTLWVSGDMYPTFTSLALSGHNLGGDGSYVQSVSSVAATIVGATGSYGSTITSYSISGHELNVQSSSGTSNTFTTSGNVTYTAKITDSRGRSATKTATIYVVPYQKPSVSITNMYRCDVNGNPQNEGTYVRIIADYSTASLSTLSRTYTIKQQEAPLVATWTTVVNKALLSSASGTIQYTIPNISVTNSYNILIAVEDNYGSATATNKVGVASCLMNIEKDGVGIGKFYTQGTLDVGGEMYIDGSLKMTDLYSTASFGMGISLRHELQHLYDTTIQCTEDYPFHVWTSSALSPSELSITDDGRLLFNGTDLYTRTVNFTPYLFSNSQTSAKWTQTSAVGKATYFGDLVYVQGRVIAVHDATPNGNAEVAIGGLPELNIWNYPPVNFGWVSGLTTALNSYTYAIRGYVEAGTSYIRLCFDYRQDASWQFLRSTHIKNGNIDVCFSVLYRWR
jgi:hypothetical protein